MLFASLSSIIIQYYYMYHMSW